MGAMDMMSETEMIDADHDDLSDSDILVLLIIDGTVPVLKTRLQRMWIGSMMWGTSCPPHQGSPTGTSSV